jgi:hypothetical protein
MTRPVSQPTSLFDQLSTYKDTVEKRRKYVKNEFQSYGLDLAKELGDWKNRSLYIRLAKTTPREILDQARYFIKDQLPNTIKTPYKLFMWKLKQIKNQKVEIKQLHDKT